jgi:hypothetical protein
MKFLSDILAKAGLTVDGVVTLNNTATGQTPNANDNSTKLATTAWVRTFVQPYSLPIASDSILGGIKVGSGLSIDPSTGVLTASGGSGGSFNFRTIQEFTATAGQTTFTISGGYTVGYVEVLINGVYLSESLYTATNGTTIVLDEAAATDDIVTVFLYSIYNFGGNIYARNVDTLTATAGQTSFTTSYIPGQIDVYYNGSKLTEAEYTATDGTTIILAQAAVLGDIVEVVTYLAGAGINASRTLTINGTTYDLTANRTWTLTTSNISEGTNLYYTTARANSDFDTRLATKSTTNLSEGTNLYYTDTRVGSYLTTNSYATQSYVSTQINNLINGAPGLLDTLDELAAALGDDANFASTVTTALAGKQASLNGTGFIKASGTTITYDNSTYALDSAVVKLTGTQTVAGTKTFTSQIITDIQVVSPAFKVQNSGNTSLYSMLLSYSSGVRIVGLPDKDGTIAMTSDIPTLSSLGGQPALSGTGFVKISGTTISYDNSTYLTSASLTGYIPYTGATGNVSLGNYELGAKYVIAEGSAGLGGVISIRQDAAYLAKGNGYSSIASSFTEFDFFGYTGASTYKNFTLKFDGLTNNTRRRYTLPDADGTLALTSNLSSYVPTSRTITINGTALDLSADRSWSVGTIVGNSNILSDANGSNVTVNGGYFTGFNPTNVPAGQSSGDWGVMNFPIWTGNSSGERYAVQLAANIDDNAQIFIRKFKFLNTVSLQTWYALLHSGNFSSYALPLSGGIMTGDIQMGNNQNRIIKFRTATAWDYSIRGINDDLFITDNPGLNYIGCYYNGGGGNRYISLMGMFNVYPNGVVNSGNTINISGQLNASGRIHAATYGNASKGSILMGVENNTENKWSYLLSTQYNSSTNPTGYALIGGYTSATENKVIIGGSIYEANPATSIEFWTHTAVTHATGGSLKMTITSGGTLQPAVNGTQDLGTSSLRWATVYTSDLSLSNGIGDYTIVEGENDLFLYNNKQNKVYKFVLAEVDAADATPKKS